MWMRIDVNSDERAVVQVNGKPTEWLGPGRYVRWTYLRDVKVRRFSVDTLLAPLRPEHAALAPATDLEAIVLEPHERAVVWQKGAPVRWLGAGLHYLWKVDRSVRVEVLDTSEVVAKPLPKKVAELADKRDYVEVTVPHGAVAVRYVDGRLDEVLGPGRHAAWTTLAKVDLPVLDVRERVLAVTGQEVMTRDRVSLRLNLSATFRVADPARLATVARDADEVLYLAVQMAAREAVTSRTLDAMLEDRDSLAVEVFEQVSKRAEAVGLEVSHVGLRDVILPGDMKVLLNQVIEAKKKAEANVILRREEAAATRAMAQTAQLLAEQPTLARLKELEAYKELAGSVGQVHLVLGEQILSRLELKS